MAEERGEQMDGNSSHDCRRGEGGGGRPWGTSPAQSHIRPAPEEEPLSSDSPLCSPQPPAGAGAATLQGLYTPLILIDIYKNKW